MPEIDNAILRALLKARPGFVSGNAIAKNLGISRVGIWARLERLRSQGFVFEGVRNRGYRIAEEPQLPHQRLLECYLALSETPIRVYCHDVIDSTNSEAERLLAQGAEDPFVVLASEQTEGRGRLGRRWHSPPEGNLYASFGFRPNLPPRRMQTITLWFGVSLCEAIKSTYEIPVAVKWPNDLISGGFKLAGMLTEARVDADQIRSLVFGLGVNVNSIPSDWPKDIARVGTSLRQDSDRAPLRFNQVAAHLIETVWESYRRFIDGSYQKVFADLWEENDAMRGQFIEASDPVTGAIIQGTAVSIDDAGALILRTRGGRNIALRAGEVTLSDRSRSAEMSAATRNGE